jgi:predicted kinase
VARDQGRRFDGLWLSAPAPTLAERVAARRGDASDATRAVVREQLAVDPGAIGWHRLDSGSAPEEVAAAAGAALGL